LDSKGGPEFAPQHQSIRICNNVSFLVLTSLMWFDMKIEQSLTAKISGIFMALKDRTALNVGYLVI
jgi:uncharacterized protein YsxB (DUF464 family)